jgi:hypothetical protein
MAASQEWKEMKWKKKQSFDLELEALSSCCLG